MPPPRLFAAVLIALLGTLMLGCADDPAPVADADAVRPLLGTWSAEDTTRFDFREEGEALWIFGDGADEDTFRIGYNFTPDSEPAGLDLTGFDRGFLEGRALYCIMALEADSLFRLDCEPGTEGNGGGTDVRPDTFTQSTTTYRAVDRSSGGS